VLERNTEITVTIPDAANTFTREKFDLDKLYAPRKYKTLYLCHGYSGTDREWTENTRIEAYAQEKQLMTVSMFLGDSFCCDMAVGYNYFTYMTEELPRFIQAIYPSSPEREDNYIAGFSMGSHSAVKAALRCPEKYAAAIGIAGTMDHAKMTMLAAKMGADDSKAKAAFGPIDQIYGSENDMLYIAKRLVESGKDAPRLILTCGYQDFGYDLCTEYHEYLNEIGLKHEYLTEDGVHDYFYVDKVIARVIREMLP